MAVGRRVRLVTAAGLALAVGVMGLVAPTVASAGGDVTSALEKKRVDSVPTPKLDWYKCYGTAYCATVKLPVDYDHPNGAKTEIALLKRPATNPKKKIGTLFVNPGGPGGSGTALAYYADEVYSENVRSRFDIVGFDPRGTNFSDNVQCFPSVREQTPVIDALYSVAFPVTKKQQTTIMAAAKKYGQACSTTGKPLSVSMSTAEVARDMDVLRRAVGDKKLSYFGFSYGTYLGQVYANLFPDRVRVLALDGVVDPIAWAGRKSTAGRPVWDRLKSADADIKALTRILKLCDKAGGQLCDFAPGDPVANFDLIAKRLKAKPLTETDPFTGEVFTFGYADLISAVLGSLYSQEGGAEEIAYNLAQLIILTEPPAADARVLRSRTATALRNLIKSLDAQKKRDEGKRIPTLGFPYDNSPDAFFSVSCTDSLNSGNVSKYPTYAANADKRAKYFGALWVWNGAACAHDAFSARDEDAYRGSFTKYTSNPILFVGDYWDPATNYNSAVAAAKRTPNSALLSSDSWGHTAYGTSECVDQAVDNYLISIKKPAHGTLCVGDYQPFTGSADSEFAVGTTAASVGADSMRSGGR